MLKQYWWLSLCFLLPFLIGGTVGWLMLLAEFDIGSQGLTGLEPELKEFRRLEPIRFLDYGAKSGFVGILIGFGLLKLFRKKS